MSELQPVIDYSAKDYAGFRRLMLDKKRELLPEWTSESQNDFGVVLIELFAYVADILSFYEDRIATEAFLTTAVNRASVVDIAQTLDYQPTGTVSATVDVEFTVTEPVTIPAGTQVSTATVVSISGTEDPVFFETREALEFAAPGTQSVACVEGETVQELIGSSDGRVDQTLELDRFPVVEGSVRLFIDEGIGTSEWAEVSRLIEAGSAQNAFFIREDANGAATVVFGDGVNGRVPARDAEITAVYRIGVGERGNVGANTLTELVSGIPAVEDAVSSLTNPQTASGGRDIESAASIRRNVPRVFAAQRRAVSLRDYSSLALRSSGVSKAWSKQVAYNTIAIYVAPSGGGVLDSSRRAELESFLDERKMSNIFLLVEDPSYAPVDITVEVQVVDSFVRQQVEDQVKEAVTQLLDFNRVDFRWFFPVSDVYDAVSQIPGVRYSNVTLLDRGGGTGKDNLEFSEEEIPTVGAITITASGGIITT